MGHARSGFRLPAGAGFLRRTPSQDRVHPVLATFRADRGLLQGADERAEFRSDSGAPKKRTQPRSEEHTSELQSRLHLVCRLLLEKKKNQIKHDTNIDSNSYTTAHNIETQCRPIY